MKTILRMVLVVCLFSTHHPVIAQKALTLEDVLSIAFQRGRLEWKLLTKAAAALNATMGKNEAMICRRLSRPTRAV